MSRTFVSLLAVASLAIGACAMNDDADLGNAELALTGHSASGTTYRLRHADLTVSGPAGTQVFHTEDDLSRTVITTALTPGDYTVALANGWNLERVNADGTTTPVAANLLTPNPLAFTIASGTHTAVVLQFQAGADQIPMSDGDADISISVNDPVAQALVVDVTSLTVVEGATGAFNVHLAAAPASPLTVTLTTSSPAAAVSPATLTFTAANFATNQVVTVAGVEDVDTVDGNADVLLTASGLMPAVVHVQVKDNDVQSLIVDPGNLVLQEGSTATLQVRLAFQPLAATTVTVSSANTAIATVAPASLTFDPANWNVAQNVPVSGVHDANVLDDSTLVTFNGAGFAPVLVPVTVKDIDTQAIIVSSNAITMNDASSATFTVKLAFQPPGPVVVSIANDNPSALSLAPATLTFTPANFATPQVVTMNTPNVLSPQTAQLTLTSPGVPSTVVVVTVKNVTFP
jgi:hypothetical protein